MVTELHHSGFLFSMVIRLKRFVTTLPAIDITPRQITCLLLHGMLSTVRDLRSQLNAKFNKTSDLYWLSCCGKPLHDDFAPWKEIAGAGQVVATLLGWQN